MRKLTRELVEESSDLSVQNGTIPGCPFPCVLGHEGGGVLINFLLMHLRRPG